MGVPDAGVTVAVSVTLVPTDTEVDEADSLVVVAVGTGATPVPVRVTTWGLPEALSAKVSVAVSLLVVAGANSTLTVQEPLTATVAETQLFAVTAKSAVFVPPGVTVVNVRLAVPVLATVSDIALLVVPWVWFPKASGLGEAANTGPAAAPLIAKTLLSTATYASFVVVFNAAASGTPVVPVTVVTALVAPSM